MGKEIEAVAQDLLKTLIFSSYGKLVISHLMGEADQSQSQADALERSLEEAGFTEKEVQLFIEGVHLTEAELVTSKEIVDAMKQAFTDSVVHQDRIDRFSVRAIHDRIKREQIEAGKSKLVEKDALADAITEEAFRILWLQYSESDDGEGINLYEQGKIDWSSMGATQEEIKAVYARLTRNFGESVDAENYLFYSMKEMVRRAVKAIVYRTIWVGPIKEMRIGPKNLITQRVKDPYKVENEYKPGTPLHYQVPDNDDTVHIDIRTHNPSSQGWFGENAGLDNTVFKIPQCNEVVSVHNALVRTPTGYIVEPVLELKGFKIKPIQVLNNRLERIEQEVDQDPNCSVYYRPLAGFNESSYYTEQDLTRDLKKLSFHTIILCDLLEPGYYDRYTLVGLEDAIKEQFNSGSMTPFGALSDFAKQVLASALSDDTRFKHFISRRPELTEITSLANTLELERSPNLRARFRKPSLDAGLSELMADGLNHLLSFLQSNYETEEFGVDLGVASSSLLPARGHSLRGGFSIGALGYDPDLSHESSVGGPSFLKSWLKFLTGGVTSDDYSEIAVFVAEEDCLQWKLSNIEHLLSIIAPIVLNSLKVAVTEKFLIATIGSVFGAPAALSIWSIYVNFPWEAFLLISYIQLQEIRYQIEVEKSQQ